MSKKFIQLKKDYKKYSNKKLSPFLRLVDFIWRKKYRQSLVIVWAIGIILIFLGEFLVKFIVDIENITFGEKVLWIIYYSTAIIIFWYTRETYDIKRIQNKQIEETRKSRYLEKMPIIRLVSWGVKKKNLSLLKKEGIIPKSKEEENYYKIVYKNIGEDWAFIKEVNFWVSNPISSNQKRINIKYPSHKKTLYKDEEDKVATYCVKINKNGYFLFPSKLEVIFNDRYNNKFKYIAKKQAGLSEPTPFLGIRDFIEEEIVYPSNLK